MAGGRNRKRLEHDRRILREALAECEAGGLGEVDDAERDSLVESIRKRIADLDERLAQLTSE